MIKGIYTSGAGMNIQQGTMDNVSNNLANATTPGYKKDRLVMEPFPQLLQLSNKMATSRGLQHRVIGVTNQGAAVSQVVTDFSPGVLRETGFTTDFALTGTGFFTLYDPNPGQDENYYYSRNGHFRLDEAGYLVNDAGYQVLGSGGAIRIDGGQDFTVNESGQIVVDGEVIDTLALVDFADVSGLQRHGLNLFRAGDQEPQEVENPGVVQGFLEHANVDPAEETVHMISAIRAYETGQRIVQAHDGMLDLAINKVGRVR